MSDDLFKPPLEQLRFLETSGTDSSFITDPHGHRVPRISSMKLVGDASGYPFSQYPGVPSAPCYSGKISPQEEL